MTLRVCLFISLTISCLLVKAQFTYLDSAYHLNKYQAEYSYSSLKLNDDKFILPCYGADTNIYFMNIFCINHAGNILWDKEYNIDSIAGAAIGKASFDQQKNIIMSGQYYNPILHEEQAVMAKADSNGNLQWLKLYPAPHYGRNQGIWGFSTLVTNDNQYLLLCSVSIDTFKDNFLIIRTDSLGNELSRWQYGSVYQDAPVGGGIETNDRGFLFSGYTSKDDSIVGTYNVNTIYIVKADSAGNQLWATSIPEAFNQYQHPIGDASALAMIEDTGGYIICGSKPFKDVGTLCNMGIGPCAWQKCWIGKVRKNDGSLIWEKFYGRDTMYYGAFTSIAWTADSNFILCSKYDWDNYQANSAGLHKLDRNGDSLWSVQFNYHDDTSAGLILNSVNTVGTSGFLASGFVEPNNSYPWPLAVTIDSNGCAVSNCLATTIKETEETVSINLYPNPANTILNVLVNSDNATENLCLNVYDLSGRVVVNQQRLSAGIPYQLNVSSFAGGIYFVQLISAEGVLARRKFIKQ